MIPYNKNTFRCAIYTRKSSDEGLDMNFTSLDAQRDAAEAYVRSQRGNGWILLPQHYDDAAYSGGTLNRPAMQQLLKDCEAGQVDIVVVYKVDRLSRSLYDFTDLSKRFENWGVSFVSVTQQIDTSTSMGKMMMNLLMTFAEYERQISSERIRDKFKASKMKGMFMGGVVALGYRVEDRQLFIVPEEAETVKYIFKRYAEIQSPKQIALELNTNNRLTKVGKQWNQHGILKILTNPLYNGKITYQGELYEGQHEAIIDDELWQLVQKLYSGNKTRMSQSNVSKIENFPMLKGILECGHCGGPMQQGYTKKGRRFYSYYRCTKDSKRTIHTCPHRHVPAPTLEEAVLERIGVILRAPEVVAPLARMAKVAPSLVMDILNNDFWQEATHVEKCRLVELLVSKVTLYEDKLVIEIRTEGVENFMEILENECTSY